jgi:hypothetical protein
MPAEHSDDVVGQGSDDGAGSPPSRLRRAGLVVGAVLVVVVLSRSGLLSSAAPAPPGPTPSPSGSSTTPGTVTGPRLVARVGDLLIMDARGPARAGSRLPTGLPADAPLIPVLPGGTEVAAAAAALPGPVVGVQDGSLFRADPARARWRDLAPADAVLAAGYSAARAVVERGGALQEVEVSTGGTTDADPFPGYQPRRWTARGLLGGAGVGALVMTRPGPNGSTRYALAYPRLLIESGQREPVRELGSHGALLSLADDWVLTLGPGCPGASCRLDVVSVTRDNALSRFVAPPTGWTFVLGPAAGRTHEALVPVHRLGDADTADDVALARLVPGGDNALLVQGTDRVLLGAGLVDGAGGSVYLLRDPGGGAEPRAVIWDPNAPNIAVPLRPATSFPAGARLVCVCG